MDHNDHVRLLTKGVPGNPGAPWADFGCGWGAFTLALADLLGDGAEIYAVDRDAGALGRMQANMRERFPGVIVHHIHADFHDPLDIPPLGGLVIANALHFQPEQAATVTHLADYLSPGGRFLIVEYNIRRARPWVPYPINFARWQKLAAGAGLTHTELLATRPSRSTREIYAAASWAPTPSG